MYIPHHYNQPNLDLTFQFIKKYNFGAIITNTPGGLHATHLPFLSEFIGQKLVISSHLAKANPHWQNMNESEQLIIFNGPHAYISPTHYEKEQNVPTWNYTAVHIYGGCTIINTDEEKLELLENTISFYEPAYINQWKTLDKAYLNAMLQAIVGFRINVTRIESKFKLSQNKTKNEIETIIHHLSASGNTNNIELAEMMKTTNQL